MAQLTSMLGIWNSNPTRHTPAEDLQGLVAGSLIAAEAGARCSMLDGEPLVTETVARLRASRDLLVRELAALPGVEVAPPPGAMYLFFKVAGFSGDSLAFAKRLVAEAGLDLVLHAAERANRAVGHFGEVVDEGIACLHACDS
mgnify:CR=1 FL=1